MTEKLAEMKRKVDELREKSRALGAEAMALDVEMRELEEGSQPEEPVQKVKTPAEVMDRIKFLKTNVHYALANLMAYMFLDEDPDDLAALNMLELLDDTDWETCSLEELQAYFMRMQRNGGFDALREILSEVRTAA